MKTETPAVQLSQEPHDGGLAQGGGGTEGWTDVGSELTGAHDWFDVGGSTKQEGSRTVRLPAQVTGWRVRPFTEERKTKMGTGSGIKSYPLVT